MTQETKPKNYLNNADLLKQIHLSKNTYCSYTKQEYSNYDYIVDCQDNLDLEHSLEQMLKPETIQLAKQGRAKRLDALAGNKRGTTDPDTIPVSDLVIRVMTWSHIPLGKKTPSPKQLEKLIESGDIDADEYDPDDYSPRVSKSGGVSFCRVNFAPFQHYIYRNGSCVCVGKSHWLGGVEDGSFSVDHGDTTKELAKMYILLAKKFSTKWNWRGYSYVEEMVGSSIVNLVASGLKFNEAKSDNPFAYLTSCITNSFTRVLGQEANYRETRDNLMEFYGLQSSNTRQINHEYSSKNRE